ncbi:MAG: ATP-binding protein [Salinivirgaceae bacterium]|nr:MAG: ATP-binding protein [Salinivirgaceae bacterium]
MDYKRFSVQIFLRVIVILITTITAGYLYFKTSFYFTATFSIALSLLQAYWLIQFAAKTNRQLTVFLDSIRHAEFNRSFEPTGLGEAFDGLSSSFNQVMSDFHNIRKEKEEQFYFYQNVVQHIGISMMAYERNGRIIMLNNAANKLFQTKKLSNINELTSFNVELVEILKSIKHNQRKLIKVHIKDDLLQLSLFAKQFKQENKEITIISIQNIETELEQNEMEAWQKLIRVLTHEIMNSITPITSLSTTVNLMVDDWQLSNAKGEDTNEVTADIKQAIQTIHKRSEGLLQFVQTYRSLTKIPMPNFALLKVEEFFSDMAQLHKKDMESANIELIIEIEPSNLEITADITMMEQVFINLIRNAKQAVAKTENPQIKLKAGYGNYGNIMLQVIDNGQGILPEVLEKIFIPFFTTKASGSGIGLSLSRQLIRAQGGNITATSKPGKTVFTVRF